MQHLTHALYTLFAQVILAVVLLILPASPFNISPQRPFGLSQVSSSPFVASSPRSSSLYVTTPDADLSDAEARLKAMDEMEAQEKSMGAVLAGKEEMMDSGGEMRTMSTNVRKTTTKGPPFDSVPRPRRPSLPPVYGRGAGQHQAGSPLCRRQPLDGRSHHLGRQGHGQVHHGQGERLWRGAEAGAGALAAILYKIL